MTFWFNTRWTDLCPQGDTGDDSDLWLFCSSLNICMIDSCDDKYNVLSTDISLLPGKKKWLEYIVVTKSFERYIQDGLVTYYMVSRMRPH